MTKFTIKKDNKTLYFYYYNSDRNNYLLKGGLISYPPELLKYLEHEDYFFHLLDVIGCIIEDVDLILDIISKRSLLILNLQDKDLEIVYHLEFMLSLTSNTITEYLFTGNNLIIYDSLFYVLS